MARHTEGIPYVDLSAQWEIERDELLPIIEKIMASGSYVNGENVKLIELKIADYCSVDYCVTLNSGTDALMLGMWALGIKPGDEVITPPNSFIASTAAIIHLGAKPIFVDVDPAQLIDINKIENLITKNTKAIMPVHLTGLMANMEKINTLAEKYNLVVIEDAAQSIGSKLNGRLSGTFGDVGCFSTHPLKNLNCCGDGGFLITNNSLVANKIRQYRNHGFVERNYSEKFGIVSRMDEIQAAILNYRIGRLDNVIKKRRSNAELFRKLLNKDFVFFPMEEQGYFNSMHTFVIQCPNRDLLAAFLKENEVQTAIHYPRPIHLQPAAKYLGYKVGDFPVAENQAERILTLPIHQYLTEKDIQTITELVNHFFKNNLL